MNLAKFRNLQACIEPRLVVQNLYRSDTAHLHRAIQTMTTKKKSILILGGCADELDVAHLVGIQYFDAKVTMFQKH